MSLRHLVFLLLLLVVVAPSSAAETAEPLELRITVELAPPEDAPAPEGRPVTRASVRGITTQPPGSYDEFGCLVLHSNYQNHWDECRDPGSDYRASACSTACTFYRVWVDACDVGSNTLNPFVCRGQP